METGHGMPKINFFQNNYQYQILGEPREFLVVPIVFVTTGEASRSTQLWVKTGVVSYLKDYFSRVRQLASKVHLL